MFGLNHLMRLSTGEGYSPMTVIAVIPGDLSPKVLLTGGFFFAKMNDGESLDDGVSRVIDEINSHRSRFST